MPFTRMLQPQSIAVFGGREAEEVIRQCDRMHYEGDIWPVHPKKTEILGRKVYQSVDALPGSPDIAYIAVNRHLTIDIVKDLSARAAGGAICFATGYSEAGEEGTSLEQQLYAAAGDMPLLGPNCYGMINNVDKAILWPDQHGGRCVKHGVAIITMSSNVAVNLTMQSRGLPISYVVSLGNKLKFDLHDAISTFAELDRVSAIGLYIEGISDPHAFMQAVSFARQLGKPLVAIKSGRSEVAQKMAMSHTASLTGSDKLMNALFERTGVARVHSMEALIEALKVLHVCGPLSGNRIGVMSTSGGDISLIGDAMEQTDLEMPDLSEGTIPEISRTVHERIIVANPLDYQMFDWHDQARMTATNKAFMANEFDLTLSLLDYPRQDRCETNDWEVAERAFVAAIKQSGSKGAIMSTLSDNMTESIAVRLMEQGVVPLIGIDSGLAGIQAALDIGHIWAQTEFPTLMKNTPSKHDTPVTVLDEDESKRILASYGIPIPPSTIISNRDDAKSEAAELGFPLVVKALGVAHKTDVGGVKLNLKDAESVAGALTDMSTLSERFLLERMVEDSIAELIIGVARDEQFGPYLVIGAGGILVELLNDSYSLLLPVTPEQVRQKLQSLKCAPLFNGFRGRPKADLDAVVDAIVSIADFVLDHNDSIEELDINPLMLLPEGVMAADALIRIKNDYE